jgi:hypothetical protein
MIFENEMYYTPNTDKQCYCNEILHTQQEKVATIQPPLMSISSGAGEVSEQVIVTPPMSPVYNKINKIGKHL